MGTERDRKKLARNTWEREELRREKERKRGWDSEQSSWLLLALTCQAVVAGYDPIARALLLGGA